MSQKEENGVLRVKMLGNFSMSYNGYSLLGIKSPNTQFTYLMQLLLHNSSKGVSRETIEETLFGDRDVEDVHRALRSVIYNAKKRLERMGLPKLNYFVRDEGMLMWTDKIPVQEDALEFERLCVLAKQTEDENQKIQFLLDACHSYTGEFLEVYSDFLWVAVEARRYRAMFYECVEELTGLLRKRQDYLQMKKVGIYASKVTPFCDWETVTMEALIGLGSYEEAVQFYTVTEEKYLKERGLKPSQELIRMLERLGDQVTHPRNSIGSICENLEEGKKQTGAYMCSYPVFRGIYHMMKRLLERDRQPISLMLCTVVDSKGNPMKESTQLDELSERLADVIMQSIRRSDVVSRYSHGQFLILFHNVSKENSELIQKRINNRFQMGRQRVGISFHVRSLYDDSGFSIPGLE